MEKFFDDSKAFEALFDLDFSRKTAEWKLGVVFSVNQQSKLAQTMTLSSNVRKNNFPAFSSR